MKVEHFWTKFEKVYTLLRNKFSVYNSKINYSWQKIIEKTQHEKFKKPFISFYDQRSSQIAMITLIVCKSELC